MTKIQNFQTKTGTLLKFAFGFVYLKIMISNLFRISNLEFRV